MTHRTASAGGTRGDTTTGIVRRLFQDPVVRAFVVLEAIVLAPYFLPLMSTDGLGAYADLYAAMPAKIVVIVAALYRPGRMLRAPERRFWSYIAGAYACWFLIDVLDFSLPRAWTNDPVVTLLEDFLYIVFYVQFALALEEKAHVADPAPGQRRLHAFRSGGAILFVSGLLTYFAVIPRDVSHPSWGHLVPSLFLYVVMDVYILTRLVAVRRSCTDSSWRRVYGFLIATACFWTLLDTVEAMFYAEVLPFVPMGTLLDLPWHLPYWTVLLAARIRELPASPADTATAESPPDARFAWGGPLILYAIAFPLIHFAVAAFGITNPQTRALREVFVVAMVLILATVAIFYQQRLEQERRRLEGRLQLSQKMEAIGRLAGGIAHDFNNVLQVVRSSSELARAELPDDAPQRRELEEIGAAADRAASLTDRLLTIGRRMPVDPQPQDLNRIVTETGAMLRRSVGDDVVLTVDTDRDLPRVLADRSEMEQVLLNLALNAREAMPDGGELEIRTHSDPDDRRFCRLTVRDSGHGMDEETRSRIFEPFFTTRENDQGTGLGLAMVYGIVVRSGGRIEVDSSVGGGTTFTIRLPVCDPSRVSQKLAPSAEATGGTAAILVVDDDPTVLSLVGRGLESLGYTVTTVPGALEALDAIRKSERPFELLLTDVRMPGLQGPDLARKVRELRPGTGILLMSGFADDSLEDLKQDSGAAAILRKPFSRDELAVAVAKALGTRSRTPSS